MNRLLLSGLAFFVFVGCGGTKSTVDKVETKKEVKTQTNSQPAWVDDGDYDGNIGVVSIVKKNGKSKKQLMYIAKMKANSAMQARKSTMVDSKTTIKKTTVNGEYKRDTKKVVKLSSSSFAVKNLVVKDTYEDKDNFYLWMVVKK
jgi:hypothetical protein